MKNNLVERPKFFKLIDNQIKTVIIKLGSQSAGVWFPLPKRGGRYEHIRDFVINSRIFCFDSICCGTCSDNTQRHKKITTLAWTAWWLFYNYLVCGSHSCGADCLLCHYNNTFLIKSQVTVFTFIKLLLFFTSY